MIKNESIQVDHLNSNLLYSISINIIILISEKSQTKYNHKKFIVIESPSIVYGWRWEGGCIETLITKNFERLIGKDMKCKMRETVTSFKDQEMKG